MKSVVQRWDFFRRVNPEFTDASCVGACLSVFAVVIMTVLFMSELSFWLTVDQVSSVQLDTSGVDTFRLNLNITFPALPCQFVSLDVSDVLGSNRLNLTHNVHKWRVQTDPADLGSFSRAADPLPRDTEARRQQLATQLTLRSEDDFADALDPQPGTGALVHRITLASDIDALTRDHPIVFVSFVAPWCPFSRALEPIWTHSADSLDKKPYRNLAAFARVDCTAGILPQYVCAAYRIHAFPTILVFENFKADGNGGEHTHRIRYYSGAREEHALFAETERILDEALPKWRSMDELSRDHAVAEAIADGSAESGTAVVAGRGRNGAVPLEGCQIHGIVDLRRVPTNLHITGHEVPGYSYNTSEMNVTHKIHHLSFGHHLLEADSAPGGKAKAHFLMQELLARGHNPLNLDLVEQPFVMEHPNATWEHFLKVVPEIYRMTSVSGDHPTYQYTTNSRTYASPRHVPEVRFSLDVSPMAVVVEDEEVPMFVRSTLFPSLHRLRGSLDLVVDCADCF
eukprot:INCI6328.1.p1 GENE.INCI6328.1~~INCI6328.1.p1  ORF type:complete len:512 (-),score=47.67 INCI6328.1:198-1733(-)